MSSSTEIHDLVNRTYTDAVTRPGGSCCGNSPKGVLAKMAGYNEEELAALPADAVVNSFGCGNPLAFSEVKPGEVVLDLGSGAGIDLLIAARHAGEAGRVIGVDMTDAMISRARENIAKSGLKNIEVRKGLIESLPVDSGSVDWVISNCVINLSPDKPKVFAEIARVLKPGGRMRVSDVVAEELPQEVRRIASLYGSCVSGAISESAYLDGLRSAGLVDVEVAERFIYEAAQINALTSCIPDGESLNTEVIASLAGKVWSAVFFARKSPACPTTTTR
jgi:SAM-dependent methyltransferase